VLGEPRNDMPPVVVVQGMAVSATCCPPAPSSGPGPRRTCSTFPATPGAGMPPSCRGIRYGHPPAPAAAVAETTRAWLHGGVRQQSAFCSVRSSFTTRGARSPRPRCTCGPSFPVRSAARELAWYLEGARYDDIDVMLFNHGTESVGLAGTALLAAARWPRASSRSARRPEPDGLPRGLQHLRPVYQGAAEAAADLAVMVPASRRRGARRPRHRPPDHADPV